MAPAQRRAGERRGAALALGAILVTRDLKFRPFEQESGRRVEWLAPSATPG